MAYTHYNTVMRAMNVCMPSQFIMYHVCFIHRAMQFIRVYHNMYLANQLPTHINYNELRIQARSMF